MPIPIFNSVASFFLKRRISQIELFKDYPIEVQQEVLRKMIVYSIDTEIGKKYDFKTIRHYNDFKESNGFTDQQIRNKTKSLRGILDPFSSNGNEDLLKRAGFKDISSIAQWLNFKGWLAIK